MTIRPKFNGYPAKNTYNKYDKTPLIILSNLTTYIYIRLGYEYFFTNACIRKCIVVSYLYTTYFHPYIEIRLQSKLRTSPTLTSQTTEKHFILAKTKTLYSSLMQTLLLR